MFTLKRLLKEAEEKQEAKKLNELLTSDEWYNGDLFLFRGSERNVDGWTIKKPYESRDPVTTNKKIQWITEIVREEYYPDYPSRNRSRFASTKEFIADNYGELYYVFPSKNANVASIEDDAYLGYLGPAGKVLGSLYQEVLRLKDKNVSIETFGEFVSDRVIRLLKTVIKAKEEKNKNISKKIRNILEKFGGLGRIQSEIKQVRFSLNPDEVDLTMDQTVSFNTVLKNLEKFFRYIGRYFNSMAVGRIERRSVEVIIEGKLIQADKDFVDKFFKKTDRGFVYK